MAQHRRWPSEGEVDRDHVCFIAGRGVLSVVELGEPYSLLWSDRGRRPIRDWSLHTFDMKRTDHEYWNSTRRFLIWLGAGMGDWSRRAYKELRRIHVESRAKNWDDVLPPDIFAWARRTLDEAMRDLDCCDNARVARMDNTGQMRRYRRQKACGCCGFSDEVHVGPDGKRYLIGFNFGH